MENIIGAKAVILAIDSDEFCLDLIGKTVTIVDEHEMEDEMIFYTVVTGRRTHDHNLKNDEEIVYSEDVKIISYM